MVGAHLGSLSSRCLAFRLNVLLSPLDIVNSLEYLDYFPLEMQLNVNESEIHAYEKTIKELDGIVYVI